MCLVMSLEFVMGEQIEWSNKQERKTVTRNKRLLITPDATSK